MYRYFKRISSTDDQYWDGWKSKGLSDETISPSTTSDNSLNPVIMVQKQE